MKGGRGQESLWRKCFPSESTENDRSPPEVRLCAVSDNGSKRSCFFHSEMRQQRTVSVFPSKPETLEIYTIHTLKAKASPGFAAGTAELSISLSNRKSFLGNKRSQTQLEQGQGIGSSEA